MIVQEGENDNPGRERALQGAVKGGALAAPWPMLTLNGKFS